MEDWSDERFWAELKNRLSLTGGALV
ncbi:hypothetical protein, partial [Kingella kingae]